MQNTVKAKKKKKDKKTLLTLKVSTPLTSALMSKYHYLSDYDTNIHCGKMHLAEENY